MLKGITVELEVLTSTGSSDSFGQPIYTSTFVNVTNVLVSPLTSEEILRSEQLHGKRAEFVLGIPKGDSHEWLNRKVKFFGKTYQQFGAIEQGQEELIPLEWHKKVKVGLYE